MPRWSRRRNKEREPACRPPSSLSRPQFPLGLRPDGQADVAGGEGDRLSISRADVVVEGRALAARDQMVAAGHEIEHRASDFLQVNDILAKAKLALYEQVLLEAVL